LTSTEPGPSVDGSLERTPAPAVSLVLKGLTLVEQADGEPMLLADLARGIGAAKSSTSNLCQVLGAARRSPGRQPAICSACSPSSLAVGA
jgi:hypothetical protein